MRILHLTLKKKWFDMIASGEKKEEYREIKPYWIKRLHFDLWNNRPFDAVYFRNGYAADARQMKLKCEGIEVRTGKEEWGAEPGKEYYVIKLGELLNNGQGAKECDATDAP
jgi:hypothetical protein